MRESKADCCGIVGAGVLDRPFYLPLTREVAFAKQMTEGERNPRNN